MSFSGHRGLAKGFKRALNSTGPPAASLRGTVSVINNLTASQHDCKVAQAASEQPNTQPDYLIPFNSGLLQNDPAIFITRFFDAFW